MTPPTDIRTRADGSIDTAHYLARGRMARSRQAHRLARRARGGIATAAMAGGVALVALAILPTIL